MSADLFEDHRTINAAADAFLATVRRVPRAGMDEISLMRARLGALTLTHQRAEEDLIIGPLKAAGHLADMPKAAAVIATIRQVRSSYSDHIRKWTPQAIQHDWTGYVAAVEAMVSSLKAVLAEEEQALYWPALKLLLPEMQARAAQGEH